MIDNYIDAIITLNEGKCFNKQGKQLFSFQNGPKLRVENNISY